MDAAAGPSLASRPRTEPIAQGLVGIVKYLALVAAFAACRGTPVPAPLPVDIGQFRVTINGRPSPIVGNAIYARCLATAHLFLNSTSLPKAFMTVHPMGGSAVGRHTLRSGGARRAAPSSDSAVTNPYYLEALIPPDTSAFEADSGWVEQSFDLEERLHGTLHVWVSVPWTPGATKPPPRQYILARFIARRERSLEANLLHDNQCVR